MTMTAELNQACCTPIAGGIGREEAEQTAALLRVLGDPARLRILSILLAVDEVCVCDFVEPLELSQPTVSHHLKLLRDAGFVSTERRGKWSYHSVRPERLEEVRSVLAVPR